MQTNQSYRHERSWCLHGLKLSALRTCAGPTKCRGLAMSYALVFDQHTCGLQTKAQRHHLALMKERLATKNGAAIPRIAQSVRGPPAKRDGQPAPMPEPQYLRRFDTRRFVRKARAFVFASSEV